MNGDLELISFLDFTRTDWLLETLQKAACWDHPADARHFTVTFETYYTYFRYEFFYLLLGFLLLTQFLNSMEAASWKRMSNVGGMPEGATPLYSNDGGLDDMIRGLESVSKSRNYITT